MKIDRKGLSGVPVNTAGSKQVGANKASAGKTSSASGSGADMVSLTASASQLQALEDRISSLPVVDESLVSDVQFALATGTHKTDPAITADNIIETEKEFSD